MHAVQGVGYRLSVSSLAEPSPVSACVLMNLRLLVCVENGVCGAVLLSGKDAGNLLL